MAGSVLLARDKKFIPAKDDLHALSDISAGASSRSLGGVEDHPVDHLGDDRPSLERGQLTVCPGAEQIAVNRSRERILGGTLVSNRDLRLLPLLMVLESNG